MHSGRTTWLPWILPVTVVAVAVLSNWAWRAKPPSLLACRTTARTSALLAAANPQPSAAWRLVVHLDRDLEPPAWLLHEGAQPGTGYELHWLPQLLAFQLSRVGERPHLIGTVVIDRAPREVAIQRRGGRIAVEVDGRRVLDCHDLIPPAAPAAWGFLAAADTGGVTLSLYDERRLVTAAERALLTDEPAALARVVADADLATGPEHAIARVRLAVALSATVSGAGEAAQRDAQVALRALGERHPDHPSLAAWLRWNEVRLAAAHGDAAGFDAALDALVGFAAGARAPEMPGLLLDLMHFASERACARPTKATPPEEVLAARRRWLQVVAVLGYTAMDIEGTQATSGFIAPENLHWMLPLAVQAADCLAGNSPQPTPAEGPGWLACRWRAFAGRNPGVAALPELPTGWRERNPLRGTVQILTDLAGFAPLAAVAMRGDVLAALDRGDRAGADEAVAKAPPTAARQAALTRALLALRDLSQAGGRGRELPSVPEALQALALDDGDGSPLANDDPLGFALDRLLRHRAARAEATLPGVPNVPEPLAWAERLLNGKPEAPAESWRALPERPLEALAAALAMQEVAGESPNWSLLDQATCFTLPLRLLAPVSRPTPVQPQPEPSPDPPPAVVP